VRFFSDRSPCDVSASNHYGPHPIHPGYHQRSQTLAGNETRSHDRDRLNTDGRALRTPAAHLSTWSPDNHLPHAFNSSQVIQYNTIHYLHARIFESEALAVAREKMVWW